MEDNQIINGLRSGDRESISYLYESMYPMVETFVLKNGGEKDDAKNLFQDAIMVLYRKVVEDADFELKSRLSTFVYAIARNYWLHKLRRSEKYHLKISTIEPDEVVDMGSDFLLKKENEDKEKANYDLIKKAIDKLPEECKNILQLMYFEEKSLKEISEKMGYTSSFVRVKRMRCMDRLKKEIKELSEQKTNQS